MQSLLDLDIIEKVSKIVELDQSDLWLLKFTLQLLQILFSDDWTEKTLGTIKHKFQECGGCDALDGLQDHPNEEI